MTEERRYGINWVDLIIKIILLILFVLLICWLFPMPKLDTFYDKVFNENIQTMKSAARDYYTKNNLPSAIGETKSMTLKQLLDNKLILEFTDKNGNTCDTTNSYVQVTKTLDSEYALKVQLTCGDESDYIIDTIGCNGTCLLSDVNKDVQTTTTKKDDDDYSTPSTTSKSNYKTTSGGISNAYYPLGGGSSSKSTTTKSTTTTIIKNHTSSGDTTNNNNNNSNKTLYYQHAKIEKDYGDWIQGNRSGNNIETKTERINYYRYYKKSTETSVYRTSTWVERSDAYNGKTYTYELQLTDIPSSVSSVYLVTKRYFNSSDYQAYLNSRNSNIYMTGNDMLSNSSNNSAAAFKNSAFKSNNFTYSFSSPYKTNGVWRIRITVRIKNTYGVSTYYDNSLNRDIYFAPIYFKVQYSNGRSRSVVDTLSNSYKYSGYEREFDHTQTIRYYRYITEYVDYNQTKWSTSRYLNGYKFTGNTQYR